MATTGRPLHIKKLHIPPSWTNVKVSRDKTSYLQVTGVDKQKKTQYIYHPLFVSLSHYNKFSRLKEFCKNLKYLNQKIASVKRDLSDPEYVMCLLFRILMKTYIRVGNECYTKVEAKKKTYGLTTLQKKHVTITNDKIVFDFIGKKHIRHKIELVDKVIAKDVKELISMDNDSIFNIKSNDLNNYLNEVMSKDGSTKFTCKDFRTFASNKLFIDFLKSYPVPFTNSEIEKNIKQTFDEVAKQLGHTKAVSRSAYVMPDILEIYRKNPKYFDPKKDTIKMIIDV